MKILLLNECHYPRGGADIVYLNTGALLQSHGHEVHYFSVRDEKNIPCEDEKYFFDKSINAVGGLFGFFYNTKAAHALERMVKDVRPDIAHVHLLWGILTPAILRVFKKYNIPVIHTAHDYLMACPVNHFLDKDGNICERCKQYGYSQCIKKKCYKGNLIKSIIVSSEYQFRNRFFNPSKYFSGIVFVSEFSHNKHYEHRPSLSQIPGIVLYNCTKDMGELTHQRGDYYLFIGRLSAEKGVEVLVNAFRQLPNLQLRIIGDGPLRKSLEALARDASNIVFSGYKKRDEVAKLIKGSRFVIIPSRCYENNPMTIVESYSCGKPVIGSRLGGIPEIIDEAKTGFTFEVGNSMDLIRVLLHCQEISNEDYVALCNESYRYFQNHFTEDVYYKKLIDFYITIKNNS